MPRGLPRRRSRQMTLATHCQTSGPALRNTHALRNRPQQPTQTATGEKKSRDARAAAAHTDTQNKEKRQRQKTRNTRQRQARPGPGSSPSHESALHSAPARLRPPRPAQRHRNCAASPLPRPSPVTPIPHRPHVPIAESTRGGGRRVTFRRWRSPAATSRRWPRAPHPARPPSAHPRPRRGPFNTAELQQGQGAVPGAAQEAASSGQTPAGPNGVEGQSSKLV